MSEVMTKIIQVKIEAFGAIQRLLPEDLCLQCEAESTVAEVLENIVRTYPEAYDLLERCACAMGEDMMSRTNVLAEDAVIVLLSPVAGG